MPGLTFPNQLVICAQYASRSQSQQNLSERSASSTLILLASITLRADSQHMFKFRSFTSFMISTTNRIFNPTRSLHLDARGCALPTPSDGHGDGRAWRLAQRHTPLLRLEFWVALSRPAQGVCSRKEHAIGHTLTQQYFSRSSAYNQNTLFHLRKTQRRSCPRLQVKGRRR